MGAIAKRLWNDEEYTTWLASLPVRKTPQNTPQDLYEIKHTGGINYLIEGGREKFRPVQLVLAQRC
ncbi:MAG: hypothetical protein ACREEM_10305, partial [Blastocatellia bacterium]